MEHHISSVGRGTVSYEIRVKITYVGVPFIYMYCWMYLLSVCTMPLP